MSDQEITALAQACGDAPALAAVSPTLRAEVWGLVAVRSDDTRIQRCLYDVTDTDSWPPGEFDGVVLAEVAALVPRDTEVLRAGETAVVVGL